MPLALANTLASKYTFLWTRPSAHFDSDDPCYTRLKARVNVASVFANKSLSVASLKHGKTPRSPALPFSSHSLQSILQERSYRRACRRAWPGLILTLDGRSLREQEAVSRGPRPLEVDARHFRPKPSLGGALDLVGRRLAPSARRVGASAVLKVLPSGRFRLLESAVDATPHRHDFPQTTKRGCRR